MLHNNKGEVTLIALGFFAAVFSLLSLMVSIHTEVVLDKVVPTPTVCVEEVK